MITYFLFFYTIAVFLHYHLYIFGMQDLHIGVVGVISVVAVEVVVEVLVFVIIVAIIVVTIVVVIEDVLATDVDKQ